MGSTTICIYNASWFAGAGAALTSHIPLRRPRTLGQLHFTFHPYRAAGRFPRTDLYTQSLRYSHSSPFFLSFSTCDML